jgi:beta-lactam-binding protein with PASTA domain
MKKILKHLFFIALSLGAVLLLILLSLKFYTRHGQMQNVPDVVEMRSDKAMRLLESEGLIPVIVDSVFAENFPRLGIVDQNPDAGAEVKKGRKIYLVVNSLDVPMVEMPDIAGKSSLRQAKNQLAVVGLRVGEIIERPDPTVQTEFDQPVLEQLFEDERILPGSPVKKFSEIDLVVGKMIENKDSTSAETLEEKFSE